ncbi:hypothetical protein [uncultured Microbacterium sp.]|uniref:hypothetical protein n=1 Tax=uncultured Microbacterium sp. TaxID=191216 RepID=UPI0025D7FE33|nr:hypothetical protein [uncultured Microbacterium sp.]
MEQPKWDDDAAAWRRFAGGLRERMGAAHRRADEAERRADAAEVRVAELEAAADIRRSVNRRNQWRLDRLEELIGEGDFPAAADLLATRRAWIILRAQNKLSPAP